MSVISSNFVKIRQYLKLTQSEMAEKLNVSTSVMKHIETGNSEPKLSVYMQLEKVVGFAKEDIEGKQLSLSDIESTIEAKKAQLSEPEVLYKISRSEKDILKDLLQLKALAKTLFHEMAFVKADRENVTVTEAIYRLNETTNQNLLALVG